jgi:hypothetical protein
VEQTFFTTIRKVTVIALIQLVVLFALVAVLSIWDVLGKDVLEKAISSIFLLIFSAAIIVIAAMEREGMGRQVLFGKNSGKEKMSFGRVVFWVVVVVIAISYIGDILSF